MGFGAGSSTSQSTTSVSNVKNTAYLSGGYTPTDQTTAWNQMVFATGKANGTDTTTTSRTPAAGRYAYIKRITASVMVEATNLGGAGVVLISWNAGDTCKYTFSGTLQLDFGPGLKYTGDGAKALYALCRNFSGGNAAVTIEIEMYEASA